MKKELIITILIFLSISLASASIYIEPIDIQVQLGNTQTFQMNITNNYDFDIFNFEFQNLTSYGFYFPSINVPKNSSKIFNFDVTPKKSLDIDSSFLVKFKFNANIPEEVTNYDMDITDQGFSTNYIIIREGDSIKWLNKDTIAHTIQSSLFNKQISPDSSNQYTFNQQGIYEVKDPGWQEYSYFHQNINVINRTSVEEVNNPNYDYLWSLKLNFNYRPTILDMKTIGSQFLVEATGEKEGILNITNLGNETAQGIYISSDIPWIIPEENDFDIAAGESKFLKYKIFPTITSSDETNKSYSINITASGINTGLQSQVINIFIPINKEIADINSVDGVFALINRWKEFCETNPNFALCNPNQTIINQTGSNNQNFSFNVSQADWTESKRKIGELELELSRLAGDSRTITDLYGANLPSILDQLNKSLTTQLENERKAKTSKNLRWIGGFFIFISGGSVYLIFLYGKKRKKKTMVDGAYEYGRYYGGN